MFTYITRRLLQMIPVVLGASLLIFVVISMAPGDYVDTNSNANMTEEKKQELRELMGLDKPIPVRYVNWMGKALKGELGDSLKFKQPVVQVINTYMWNSFYLSIAAKPIPVRYVNWMGKALKGELGDSLKFKQPVVQVINTYMWNSFYLSIAAFVASILIAVPIGIVSATKQYSLIDGFFTVIALIGISLPAFFLGLLLIKILAFDTGWFPVSGMTTTGMGASGFAYVKDVVYHMFLPFLVLTLIQIGSLMRYTRTSMLEVIRQDYIRTARDL